MSTTTYAIYGGVFLFAVALSPLLESLIGSALPWRFSRPLAESNINAGLKQGDAWTVHEREGRRYELLHLQEGDLPNSMLAGGDDDQVHEDVGLMGHVDAGGDRVPLGCSFDGHRVITSPLVSKIGERYGDKLTDSPVVDQRLMTDGGQADAEHSDAFKQQISVDELREKALMGRGYENGIAVEVVNGAATVPNAAVADVKETVRVLKHAGDPEQPKRAAENAENAERARSSDKSTFDKLKPFAYIGLGFVITFIAMRQGGGGGGGGGGSVPGPDVSGLAIDPGLVADLLASGVIA